MKLFKHLTNYEQPRLEVISINGREYKTVPDFQPSVLVSQAFGGNRGNGSYNVKLAQTVLDARQFFPGELPAIVQSEVGELLSQEKRIYSIGKLYEQGESSGLVSKTTTDDILEQAKCIIRQLGIENQELVYIAHPAHMYRVIEIGRKKGLEGIPFFPAEVNWPSNDLQKWVRSPARYIPREILTRIHHKVMGLVD